MKRFLRLTALRVSLLATLGVLCLYVGTAQVDIVRNLEANLLDLRFRLRGTLPPGSQIALVAIDEPSLAELGRWPWSRRLLAEGVQQLQRLGARVIAFDLLFVEPDANSAGEALRAAREAFDALHLPRLSSQLAAFRHTLTSMEAASDPDGQFARAIQDAGNVVLAFSFDFTTAPAHPPAATIPLPPAMEHAAYRALQHLTPATTAFLPRALALQAPLARFRQSARALGHANVGLAPDGALRYEYPVVAYQDGYYPSLAIQVVRLYHDLAPEEVKVRFGEGLQVGPGFVPTDQSMRLLLNYYGPAGVFPTYAFADVLRGRLPSETFRDKIVLIGGLAVGVADIFVTPFAAEFSGLEKQATVIANLLQASFLHRREVTALLDLTCIVIVGLLLGWLSPKLPSFWGSLVPLGVAGIYMSGNYIAFTWAHVWLNLLFPLLAVLSNYVAITVYLYLTEARQKRTIRQAFQHYLDPSVVEQVSQHPELLQLGGEERELTVLFSDIRGFTSISEQLTPTELIQLLNDYLTAMAQAVLDDDGLVDKYIGDALMAIYGAPVPDPEHAYRACHTAVHMLTRLQTLQPRWQMRGLPVIDIGIGINTGPMIVGNMGSDFHLNYSVIGDAVNLASRLESANKVYGTHILISESTWLQVRDRIATRELDLIQVQGKEQSTRIFEILGLAPLSAAQATLTEHFAAGLDAYRVRQWEQARQHFQHTLAHAPEDIPSRLYIQRCEEYQAFPPPRHWDGVYVMQSK